MMLSGLLLFSSAPAELASGGLGSVGPGDRLKRLVVTASRDQLDGINFLPKETQNG